MIAARNGEVIGMKQNLGDADRAGRMLIAGVLTIVFFAIRAAPRTR
jgi:hypothetical protein